MYSNANLATYAWLSSTTDYVQEAAPRHMRVNPLIRYADMQSEAAGANEW